MVSKWYAFVYNYSFGRKKNLKVGRCTLVIRTPSNCQNISLLKLPKTKAAETRATKFRTRATTTLRKVHIHKRRNIHLSYNLCQRTNERHWRASELGVAICFKSKYERIFVVVAVSFSFEIKGQEEAYNPEKRQRQQNILDGQKRGKRRPDRVILLCRMDAQVRRISGNYQNPVENGRKSPRLSGIWGRWSRVREARGERAAKKA